MIIIPVRLESSRIHQKPLQYIGGLPMIVVTAKACQKAYGDDVVVATDNVAIAGHCKAYDIDVVHTGPAKSGTDRVAEATHLLRLKPWEWVINVQGDYPFISEQDIEHLVHMERYDTIYTLVKPLLDGLQHDTAKVKAVLNDRDEALYFSRKAVPINGPFYEHVGIYAYSVETVQAFTMMERSTVERSEDIEHLRALDNGIRIKCIKTDFNYLGVNTPDDLEQARKRAET